MKLFNFESQTYVKVCEQFCRQLQGEDAHCRDGGEGGGGQGSTCQGFSMAGSGARLTFLKALSMGTLSTAPTVHLPVHNRQCPTGAQRCSQDTTANCAQQASCAVT